MEKDFLTIGKILTTHGVKGEVKVLPLTDFPSRYKKLTQVYLNAGNNRMLVSVEKSRPGKGQTIILKLAGFNTPEAAVKLRNYLLEVKREDAVKLPAGHYFISDIVGLDVYTTEGEFLGKVTDVLEPGSNDVYVVRGPESSGGREYLIPAIKEVVKEINLDKKKMVIFLMEGLR